MSERCWSRARGRANLGELRTSNRTWTQSILDVQTTFRAGFYCDHARRCNRASNGCSATSVRFRLRNDVYVCESGHRLGTEKVGREFGLLQVLPSSSHESTPVFGPQIAIALENQTRWSSFAIGATRGYGCIDELLNRPVR